jgi:hypothetical protein
MKTHLFCLIIILSSCSIRNAEKQQTIRDRYLMQDTTYMSLPVFNDSICEVAVDSAKRRFAQDKFELYAFIKGDSSETPIHLLQKKFHLKVIGYSEKDRVFRFCYNEGMISAFVEKHKFNPIDSVHTIYDSLDRISLTYLPEKFGNHFRDFSKFVYCNLQFPHGTNISPPYPQVSVKFRISPTGAPDSIKIVRSFSNEHDDAVLKLFDKMPLWRPARGEDGKYQLVYVTYPITFDPAQVKEFCP